MPALLGSARLRLGVGVVLLLAGAAAVALAGGPSPDEIEEAADSAGAAAPLAFVLLYVVLTVLLFPGSIPSAAAGALFGVALGTVLTVVGATIGATAAFLIGRRLGRAAVEELAGQRVQRLDAWLERRGLFAVLYVRLVPVFPFNLINYAAGVSAVSTRDYVVGTAIGIVPGSFAFVALGSSLSDPTSPAFAAALGLVLLLTLGGALAARRGGGAATGEP